MKINLIFILLVAMLASACTVTQTASVAVNRYCGKPEAARLAYRAAMADALAPHYVEIHCVHDQP